MVNAPDPEPDFGEPQIEFQDTGRVLKPMNEINEDPLFN
jgi:hypothetical protein